VGLADTHYATDRNLAARQRLWQRSARVPALDLHEWVLAVAAVASHERVVEVGCGNGAYLALIPDAVGVDRSIGMVTATHARAPNPLIAADVVALPFRTNAYDVVLAPHMLYHVDDRVRAAHELRRVLSRDGRCIAVTNGNANQRELVSMVEDVVRNGWRWQRQDRAFTLENGAVPLATAFDEVERIDAPASAVHVTDADAFADYVASVDDLYGPQVSSWIAWTDVVDECRRRVAAIVERDGAFVISSVFGAFVCR
jgi:SAM-dependent methyltransferase